MSAAYAPEEWQSFFIGVAGAAGPLIGLLFVSLSINLQRILSHRWLPRRAGVALCLMFEALILAIMGLIPSQSRDAFGVELLVVGGVGTLFALGAFTVRRPGTEGRERVHVGVAWCMSQLATLAVVASAVSELLGAGGGLYWLVPAVILLLGVGTLSAWVLLVEILR
jgi:hypothetical protein